MSNGFIDIYCERTAAGLWDEPLNALSNLAFFVAVFFAWRLARREGALGGDTALLLVLLLAIGIGSSLFHTLATRWAMLADTLPILLFQIGFLAVYSRRVIGYGTVPLLVLFAVLVIGFGMLPQHWLNGSVSYIPAWLFLTGLGLYHYRTRKAGRNALLMAVAVFTLSLSLRSIDMVICPVFPWGVHYLWHVLNAVTLYLALRALFLNSKPS